MVVAVYVWQLTRPPSHARVMVLSVPRWHIYGRAHGAGVMDMSGIARGLFFAAIPTMFGVFLGQQRCLPND
jgi:hypothetical protein